jgi:uncharacterized membrane protein YhdT
MLMDRGPTLAQPPIPAHNPIKLRQWMPRDILPLVFMYFLFWFYVEFYGDSCAIGTTDFLAWGNAPCFDRPLLFIDPAFPFDAQYSFNWRRGRQYIPLACWHRSGGSRRRSSSEQKRQREFHHLFCIHLLFRVRFSTSANKRLLHEFNFAQAPFFGEEGFERAVEAQQGEPSLFRIRLDPVAALHTFWLCWAEIDDC